MFKEQQEKQSKLENLAEGLQKQVETAVPRLDAKFEQLVEGSLDETFVVSIQLLIQNRGAPTTLDEWYVYLVRANGARIKAQLRHFDSIDMQFEKGKYKLSTEDYIYEKTATNPIVQGGMCRGFVIAVFPDIPRSLLLETDTYEVTFKDAYGKEWKANHSRGGSKMDQLKYYPGTKAGVVHKG